jgi:hypothetical protein
MPLAVFSFDHLVGTREHNVGHRQAECLAVSRLTAS